VDRLRRALPLYALLEAGIGISALLFPLALAALAPVYVWSHRPLAGSPWLFGLVRFALAFALLSVPTALMGATLPVLSRYMVQNHSTLGWSVGTLYALNTGGAVLGCFLAGYVLLASVGVRETVWIGGALNLGVALVVWIGRRWAEPSPSGDARRALKPVASGVLPRDSPPRPQTVRRVLVCFTLAGVAALSYEVIWTRALTFFI